MYDYENQIKNMMQEIKYCYKERKAENIQRLSDNLFNSAEIPIIIGTSNDEWIFGVQDAGELFLSDWNNWGNIRIDLESLTCEGLGEYAWFHVKAGIEYCFEDNEDTYADFMEYTGEIAASTKPVLSKAGEIIWMLSHLLHQRVQGERKYEWEMNITGILKNINNSLKIKFMQFSIPVLSAYSDVRIDMNPDNQYSYTQECDKIKRYNSQQNMPNDTLILQSIKIDLIKQQISSMFEKDISSKLTYDSLRRYIGTDGKLKNGNEFTEYLSDYMQSGTISLLPENIIVEADREHVCFNGVGMYKRKISLDKDLSNILNINNYNNIPDKKEALFNIRRDLALVIKEASLSDECNEPFRIEGIAECEDGHIIFIKYLQISYPFNCVLEQKTDASKKI